MEYILSRLLNTYITETRTSLLSRVVSSSFPFERTHNSCIIRFLQFHIDTMASSDAKTMPESQLPESRTPVNLFSLDFALRLLLLASSVTGIVIMVTSKQTEMVPVPILRVVLPKTAKWTYSPAFIYLVVALSVAGLYSIFTLLASITAAAKPCPSTKLLFLLAFFDLIVAGLVVSATGAGAAVAYLGLQGNSHAGWAKVCGVFDKYCRQVGSSTGMALIASIALVLMVVVSTYSLYRRSR